jgi:hypothetical protein
MNALRCGYLALVTALFSPILIAWQSTPEALQASGIARLDGFRDQVRRTGFQPSQLAELQTAAADLDASYRGFVAASNSAQAAWSLVKLADCERFRLQIQRGDPQADALARKSHDHYLEAAELARKTGSAAYLVKALIALALMERSRDSDYGSANSRVTEALRAAASCPNRDCLADALGAKAEVEIDRGELFSAASHVNGWLALLKGGTEPSQLYYAYMDRADVFQGMARGCPTNYQKSLETCFRLFDLGKADPRRGRRRGSDGGGDVWSAAGKGPPGHAQRV